MTFRWVRFVAAVSGMLLLNCGPRLLRHSREPEINAATTGETVWNNLSRLRSFKFSLSYRTDWPQPLAGNFTGVYNPPDVERWEGYWERAGERKRVLLFARGDVQFQYERGAWRRGVRGLETRVFEQLAQVFQGAQLEFIGLKNNRYRYRFKPNLPLLDLPGNKDFVGVLEVNAKNGMPVRIHCAAKDGSAEWDMRLMGFNRAGRVNLPFVPGIRLIFSPESRNPAGRRKAVNGIVGRLKNLGVEYRLKCLFPPLGGKVELLLDEELDRPALELIFARGRVELWEAVRADTSSSARPVQGDVAQRVKLERLIGYNRQLEIQPIFEPLVFSGLRVKSASSMINGKDGDNVPRAHLPPGRTGVFALVVDGVVVGTGSTEGGAVVFKDVGNQWMIRVIGALAAQEPLPAGMKIISVERRDF